MLSDIKVLMYHQVVAEPVPPGAGSWQCVPAERFRKQIKWLDSRGYTTISFSDYRLFLDENLHLPKKPIILTFDDGFQNVHANALPIMKEFGMKGVVFVLGDRKIRFNNWEEPDAGERSPLLTDRQILELHDADFEVGAHSMSHARLTELPRDKVMEEISRSRIMLEILLNAPILTFAYPYGLLDNNVKQMVRHAGYRFACGVYTGPGSFGLDPFDIRRITITADLSMAGFTARIVTPYPQLEWMRWRMLNAMRRSTRQ